MTETLITSVFAFVATNIDDLFIIMMLLSQSQRLSARNVFAGQYVGMIALIAISLVGIIAGMFIPLPYIGLLGFFPIYLGIKEWLDKDDDDDEIPAETFHRKRMFSFIAPQTVNVAAITIANGGITSEFTYRFSLHRAPHH